MACNKEEESSVTLATVESYEDSSGSEGETEPARAFHRQLSTKEASNGAAACREGYLLKQTCSFQRWRRRFFRLRGRKLFYAKQSKAAIFDEIDLGDARIADCSSRGSDFLGFQVITTSRSLVLCAESRRDMEEWMAALRAAAAADAPEVVTVPGSGRPRALSTSAQAEVLSGNHHWYATSHARPTYCNVCREALSGVTSHGLSCEVCKAKVHKRCACKTLNNCKWTTLASLGPDIIEDKDGNITMPHQWMEGNLPVSAKCSVCDRTCGSVLRLQDWRCLWCNATVHTACRPAHPVQCNLGPARVSVVPPTALHSAGSEEAWEAGPSPKLCSPLLVFVNSRSGDNQGLRFLRRFRQLLNPAQVFDLVGGGPSLGLRLFKHLKPFRVLVCGGDGSVGWVLTEIDRMGLHSHCRVGVLPLGTGNDLARVLGWGSACDHDANLPHLLERYEQATTKMLDRWSVLCLEREVIPADTGKGEEAASTEDTTPCSVTPEPEPPQKQQDDEPRAEDESDDDDDDDDDVGEIPYVDMPGVSLEEELEEDTLAAARLLCERAERFLADTQEGEDELRTRCKHLGERLEELRQAIREHEIAASADTQSSRDDVTTVTLALPTSGPESDLEDEEEEIPRDKEHKDLANAARLRRSSCRRKVVARADSVENALQEASSLVPPPSEVEEQPAPEVEVPSVQLLVPPSVTVSSSSNLLSHPLLQTPSFALSPETSRCPSPASFLGVPPSSFLGPSLTTNFPLLLTPTHSRSPSPAAPLSTASSASSASDIPTTTAHHVTWLPPPPSMFADGSALLKWTAELASCRWDAGGSEETTVQVTVQEAAGDLPSVVVSAPSPDHEVASPPPSPDENFLFDPFFLSDYRRSSHDSSCSSRRSSATRRISSGCLFASPGEMLHLTCPTGSPSSHSRSPPSPRGSFLLPRGSIFSPRGSMCVEESNRKLPIINPLVRLPESFISQALLANADTLCAAVSPLMDHDDSLLEGFYERCVMNNYFGIGIDAKISLAFHQKREEHPEQCRSRARNYMWYGVLGSREALKRSCRKLEQRLTLECDGQRIPLPSLQGIVVLNIPSFMGGTNFWGGSKGDECFLAPSFDDRILEVVAVFGSVQMAASRILSAQSHRIAQCSSVQIGILGDEGVPVQVDGEAWVQPPGMIRIIHKNRMQMLCRNRALESSLRSWEEKQRHHHEKPTAVIVPPPTSCVNQTDDERLALLRFIEAASSLVKCVKLLSIASRATLPEQLYMRAEQTSARLEALHPGGKIVETNELPALVTQLVVSCRQLHEDACTAAAEAKDDLASKLGSALLAMANQLHMTSTDTTTGITTFLSEEQSKSRSPLPGLGWLRLRGLRRGSEDKGSKMGRAVVESWSAQEVAAWLSSVGLTEYRENFTQHDIQGRELLSLGRRDLRELGVEKLGHVKRILQGIKDLQTS